MYINYTATISINYTTKSVTCDKPCIFSNTANKISNHDTMQFGRLLPTVQVNQMPPSSQQMTDSLHATKLHGMTHQKSINP